MKKKRRTTERFKVGGEGERAMKSNLQSEGWQRYTNAGQYKNAKCQGRFDIPHVVLSRGNDIGKGWSMGMEIEFEHGGVGTSIEMEAEETGEYETEVERGGEVNLEQFWLQKSFGTKANLRIGHIIVPVGYTNQSHLPTQFFTVYRHEGENTIMPCTWHAPGISFCGPTTK